jgi:putative ABC transport system permease protein
MPDWKTEIRRRLAGVPLQPQREAAIVEELSHDLDDCFAALLAAGLTASEAEIRAVQSYDWQLLADELRHAEVAPVWQPPLEFIERRGGNRMNSLLQDLRFGVRMLMKQPGFTVIAALTLALGIGANTTIFSAIESVILHPFAFPNQERLVAIYERMPSGERELVTPGALHDWRGQSRSFEQFVSTNFDDFTLTGGDRPAQLSGYRVSAGFFSALGVQPMLGRTFQADEDTLGREQVVVLKHSLWERLFASDPKVLGRTIKLDTQTYTIIGVMPREFNFPFYGGELWIPSVSLPADAQNRVNHSLRVIGLLKPGVSRAQGDAEIRALSLRAQQQYPATNRGVEAYTVGFNEDQTRGTRMYLSFTLGAVMFVLLIACANVANLLLARGAARQKEIAVRMALGASRWRVMRQLLTESLMVALLGGVLGLGFSVWGITALANSVPQDFSKFIPGWERLGINGWALGFTVLASLVTGVLCGLLPAWQATKSDFNETLKDGGKVTARGARNRWRNTLVVAEVALSLVLLIGAGLVIRSFVKILNTDLGFNPDNTMALYIALPQGRYTQDEQRLNLYQTLAQRVAALPGVAAVGWASGVPPGGWGYVVRFKSSGSLPSTPAQQLDRRRNGGVAGLFRRGGVRRCARVVYSTTARSARTRRVWCWSTKRWRAAILLSQVQPLGSG